MSEVLNGRPFAAFVVCRRYWGHNLKTVKKLGTKHAGQYLEGTPFSYQGGQIRSLMSLISYLGTGEYRDRYLGVKIPSTNIQDHHLRSARDFAGGLADRLRIGRPWGEGVTVATARHGGRRTLVTGRPAARQPGRHSLAATLDPASRQGCPR